MPAIVDFSYNICMQKFDLKFHSSNPSIWKAQAVKQIKAELLLQSGQQGLLESCLLSSSEFRSPGPYLIPKDTTKNQFYIRRLLKSLFGPDSVVLWFKFPMNLESKATG